MGRAGGGGGGHHHSSSGHHSSSHSHSSSRSSHSSSYRSSSRSSSSGGSYHSYHYSSPETYRSYRRSYSSRGPITTDRTIVSRLSSLIISIVILLIIGFAIRLFFTAGNGSFSTSVGLINEDVVLQNAEKYFKENKISEDSLLLYYSYLEKQDIDNCQMIIGDNVYDTVNSRLDNFWDKYDEYYFDYNLSKGEWLGKSISNFGYMFNNRIKGNDSFDSNCVDDKNGFLTSSDESVIENHCKMFYDETGIQMYVVTVDYNELPGAEKRTLISNKSIRNILIVICIFGAGLIGFAVFCVKLSTKQREEELKAKQIKDAMETPLEKVSGESSPENSDDILNKYI